MLIPHFNELDRIPIPARNVHQNSGEVADTFAVTQLLFNFFFHFIRHAGIACIENAAGMSAVVVVAAAENHGFTVKQCRVYATDIVWQPVDMLLRVVHLDKNDIFLRPYLRFTILQHHIIAGLICCVNGTGYQLLNNLGRAFSIPDYIWYQLPDGSLYVGGAEKAMFAGRPVDIPAEFSQGAAGGNSITLPVIQSLRPGVELNGERVTKVHLTNDTMAITWTPRNRATGQPLQKTPAQRQIESHYPELASGLHLPKLARVVAPSETVKSGNFADPFRPRYAVDVQLLDADGNPDNQTPVYSAVPLPVPMAGNDSGMFQFPPEGTLVEVAFTGGRPDKPFIRQTLPDGTSLPDIKPGEQLQQQRAEVSQRVTQAGDWVRQTDQTISETSMARTVKADTEQRDLVSRETTVKATDKTTVLGTTTLMAGAIQQVSAGDYSQAVKGNRLASIEGNDETDITGKQSTKVAGAVDVDVGGTLTEKIAALRKSVAAGGQQIMGPTVHIGSESVNTLTMMLDTIDLLAELAQQCASHSHPNVGTPTNAGAFTQTAEKAGQTRRKYQKIIA